eukprot:TRINITY_DN30134_c0_g1_i1.p1 TRINITY_DN30134_c0_g1~~TRINITY_DN30134_c0_g1_i1.p1  ORF type:complete len:321 (+),score=36.88 TRINITY_DN30134_c0_g1_i1:198-1160(+)
MIFGDLKPNDSESIPEISLYSCAVDALDFSFALSILKISEKRNYLVHFQNYGFSLAPFVFTKDYTGAEAPLEFDIIETSNVSDSVGLLNMLITASPHLKPLTSSLLSTDLLVSSLNISPMEFLESVLGFDPLVLFASLGLVLTNYVYPWNTTNMRFEEIFGKFSQSVLSQQQVTLSWQPVLLLDQLASKAVNHPLRLAMDMDSLTNILLSFYKITFQQEDLNLMHNPDKIPQFKRNERAGFAYTVRFFLSLLSTTNNDDRKKIGEVLFEKIECWGSENQFVFYNMYQDLLLWFHLYDIVKCEDLDDTQPGILNRSMLGNC